MTTLQAVVSSDRKLGYERRETTASDPLLLWSSRRPAPDSTTLSVKREISHFLHVVVQNCKEMYKKVWCTCKAVDSLIKPIFYFLVRRPQCFLRNKRKWWQLTLWRRRHVDAHARWFLSLSVLEKPLLVGWQITDFYPKSKLSSW